MGPVFTSPVAPAGSCVCWAVTGSTNNALTAPSNFNHIDTSNTVHRQRGYHRTDGGELCPRSYKASVDYALEIRGHTHTHTHTHAHICTHTYTHTSNLQACVSQICLASRLMPPAMISPRRGELLLGLRLSTPAPRRHVLSSPPPRHPTISTSFLSLWPAGFSMALLCPEGGV